jgi:hypothetical protein
MCLIKMIAAKIIEAKQLKKLHLILETTMSMLNVVGAVFEKHIEFGK